MAKRSILRASEIKCKKCDSKVGPPFIIDFVWDGLQIKKLCQLSLTCPKCTEQLLRENLEFFKKRNPSFIKRKTNGQVKTDWLFFVQVEGWENNEYIKKLREILCFLGVIIPNPEPNKKFYVIIAEANSMNWHTDVLNPWLYFTHKSDVYAYARQKYGKTCYYWHILEVTDVFHKAKVLKWRNI